MLTPLTQTAIALLYDISNGGLPYRLEQYSSYLPSVPNLLSKLESGGLIIRKKGCPQGIPASYQLNHPAYNITLLDILEATGEHLNCNHPTYEEMYHQYRRAANKLGIINHMTRLYLSNISLTDL